MFDPAVAVGFLHAGDLSAEQRAALEWCEAVAPFVETVSIPEIAAGTADLDRYDVCWWHRAAPLEDLGASTADAGPAVRSYAERGGGLLLSLRALSAVDALRIDPVVPDLTGVEESGEPTGYLAKSIYADDPPFAAFDDLRIHTCEPGHEVPYARYERVLPERGEMLAATVDGGMDRFHEPSLVSWAVGNGSVVGAGSALAFDGPVDGTCASNRSQLVGDLLALLAEGDHPGIHDPRSASGLTAMRERLAGDPLRPQYHLTPPANWLNDPNGIIEHDDRYHVFYQYNPAGPMHGTIHWGHAVSDDLVRWEDEPVALTPSPDGPDRDGCWSGCAVENDGTATVFYTGGRGPVQLPCRADAANPDLSRWNKDPNNPVIEQVPEGVVGSDHWEAEFRDHCIWFSDGLWHHLIGSGLADVGGAVFYYTSPDLREWEYVGPLLVGDGETGGMWECPELLELDERDLLHVSNYEDVIYFLGEFRENEFHADRRGLLDHGDLYAPQSLFGEERYLTWGWIPELRDERAQWDAGWSGTLSIPRELAVEDGQLRQRPAPELEALRRSHARHVGLDVEDGSRKLDVRGRAIELRARVQTDASEAGIGVFESPDGVERTRIGIEDGKLVVHREDSSLAASSVDPRELPIDDLERPLDLRVFLDDSVLEVFVNERRTLSTRVYPTRPDSDGLSVHAHGGSARFEELEIWTLGSAWNASERGPTSNQ
ncbi:GH32 C-terminal domain-containing protein [Halalkalicoccus sp. NIPERK01]|uniref:glycoside hydrolase family 32 protein n=1 Tax=Halalkalicoccus sp. NIPERK01 TaxID=3053469 RepID=UPI00256EE533|nr:GH32 C-terminal domain-containing protein [Halalkalicoccus sp. NIPERK01]MDL5362453.1 GH32 C-terminal domain-containing protein [Halalkalicoccus sp. NIPERK01]